MNEIKYPNGEYKKYIEYVSKYCKKNNLTLILKGSLASNSACEYSDIDLLIFGRLKKDNIYEILYNYGNPILIDISTNPKGMLIITYENNISVDLDIRETIIKEDIINENKILVNNGIEINKSVIRYDLNIRDYCPNYSKELFEILKLIIKGTNKYYSNKKTIANEFLVEIKEKCEAYFGIKEIDFNNDYRHDIELIYEYLISKNNIDKNIQKYMSKQIGIK